MTMTTTEQTCGPACWNAAERECRCSCGGTKHGAALTGDTGKPLRRECVIDGHRYLLGTVTLAYHAYSTWAHLERASLTRVPEASKPAMNDVGAIMWRRLASVAQTDRWPEVAAVVADIRAFREAHAHGRTVRVPRPYLIWIREDAAPDFDAYLARERAAREQDVPAGYTAAGDGAAA